MASQAEIRVTGDILIPLEFNADLSIALAHAGILSRLFSIKLRLVGNKEQVAQAGSKEQVEVIAGSFVEWVSKKGSGFSFVIINTASFRAGQKQDELEELIRLSPIPVMSVCNKPKRGSYESLLMPLDLTVESTQKVSTAIDFSAANHEMIVQVVSVLFGVDDFVINRLLKQIEEVRYTLEQKNVKCSAELIKTDESETISEVVSELVTRFDTDLLMIMSQQAGDKKRGAGLHRDVLDIIASCPAPVITIHPN